MIITPVETESVYFKNHKKVVQVTDEEAGFTGYIAIHNDNLGSAVGGTRMFPYTNSSEALDDVLKLSLAMTYKCALAGVPHGGGKGVIIGDPKKDKTEKILHAYAQAVESFKGQFHTGEDVGITQEDVQLMLRTSENFIGRNEFAADPSPYAALSTFVAIKQVALDVMKRDSLDGVTVTVKGLGKVGGSLVELLTKEHAHVIASDIDPVVVEKFKKEYPSIEIVSPSEIFTQKADIYAPCAMGNEFSSENVSELQVPIICGSANNQLCTNEVGLILHNAGIVYVPDYVANAGGLIDVVDELEPDGYHHERVIKRIDNIKDMVTKVLSESKEKNIPTNVIADKMAEDIFLQKE